MLLRTMPSVRCVLAQLQLLDRILEVQSPHSLAQQVTLLGAGH